MSRTHLHLILLVVLAGCAALLVGLPRQSFRYFERAYEQLSSDEDALNDWDEEATDDVVPPAIDGHEENSGEPAHPSAPNPRAIALIDKLADVSEQGAGFHATAWMNGFIALDDDLEFGGGMLGSPKPPVDPAMRELVRMGVPALPDLLSHLSDKRKTKLIIGRDGILTAKWHSNEYDPRNRNSKRRRNGVNTHRDLVGEDLVDEYTLKVGDLCFVALGQIVNRRLNAVRYQPSGCLVINSPVETPMLAAAARKDWSGLTAKEHKDSLINDAMQKRVLETAALKRLLFYYPDEGEALALKMLNRPWYDSDKLWHFIDTKRVAEKDSKKWRGLIDEVSNEYGQAAAEAIPFKLQWMYWRTSDPGNAQFPAEKAIAARIVKRCYPEYHPSQPPFINATETNEQAELVRALSGFRSEKFDPPVLKLFRSIDLEKFEGFNRVEADNLALACMDRLIGKGFDKEFAAYCELRIKELQGKKREMAEEQRLKSIWERLERIRAGGIGLLFTHLGLAGSPPNGRFRSSHGGPLPCPQFC